MFYKNILYIFFCIILTNCTTNNSINNKSNKSIFEGYSNKGFTLVYSEDLYNKKIINKKIDERSLIIFQKNLKVNTEVKITNILNQKSLIAKTGIRADYPSFNNSVLSIRIANELDLDISEPYIQIDEISKNSMFIAKKAKTFEEEKKVASKVPVNNIMISDLSESKIINKKKSKKKFSYLIKIADFYFYDTALSMVDKINIETLVINAKIRKVSKEKFRVYLGPYYDINTLQKSYNDINILKFDNIEIIKND